MADRAAMSASDAGKSPEQLLAERVKRVQDAAEMKQPDRIPIALRCGYFMADVLGCTHADVYKADVMQAALEKICLTFQPTITAASLAPPATAHSGRPDDEMARLWSARYRTFQYDEHEYMKADDYDALIKDPADWALRFYTPRIFSELKGLAKFPHFGLLLMGYYGMFPIAGLMSDPEVVHAFKKLAEVGEFHQKWFAEQRAVVRTCAPWGSHRIHLSAPSGGSVRLHVRHPARHARHLHGYVPPARQAAGGGRSRLRPSDPVRHRIQQTARLQARIHPAAPRLGWLHDHRAVQALLLAAA